MTIFEEDEDLRHFGPYEKRKYRTRTKIDDACLELIMLDEILTTKKVSMFSGVSIPTVMRYHDIISKYDAEMILAMADRILGVEEA